MEDTEIKDKETVPAPAGFKRFLGRVFISRKKFDDGRKALKNIRVLAAVSFLGAAAAGYVLASLVLPQIKTAERFVKGISKSEVPLGEVFVFSDFESPGDLKAWKGLGARIEQSPHYPSSGLHSAYVTILPEERLSSIVLDNLLKSRRGGSDWTNFQALAFTIYAPLKQPAQVTLKITDLWGKQYTETLKFPGGEGVSFAIPLEKIAGVVNVKKIDTVSFTFQNFKGHREFYFDHLRLIPAVRAPGAGGDGPAEASGLQPFDYGFAHRKSAWRVRTSGSAPEVIRIPFGVVNETKSFCHLCPVEGSIPFPLGEVRNLERLRLGNARGESLPFQARVLARWPDGSVKWAGLHLKASLAPGQGTGFFLDYGPGVEPAAAAAGRLTVREDAGKLVIETGPLRAVLDKKTFYLFDEISLDLNRDGAFSRDERMVSGAQLYLRFAGEEYRTDIASDGYELEVEEAGPARAVVRAKGWFYVPGGKRFSKVLMRYYFYEGKSDVKVSHTFIYTGYPANEVYSAYKGLRLPPNEPVDAFGLTVPYAFEDGENYAVFWGREGREPFASALKDSAFLFQKDWDAADFQIDGSIAALDGLSSGWINIQSRKKGVSLALRHFRENYPKAFRVSRAQKSVQLDLWPREAGLLDLQTTEEAVGDNAVGRGSAFGLAKTHEVQFHFHEGNEAEAVEKAGSFAKRLVIRNNPYWVDATGALGRLLPVDRRYGAEEKVLENLFDWAQRHPRLFRWYGMLNFGDTQTWWREKEGKGYGWHPDGRWGWYNAEGAGTHTGALLQFVRSGLWKYFEFGENLARHIMDVDTVHYNTIREDPRLRHVLNDEFSRVGSMHRHNALHWGGRNEEASHTNITGIVLYHYLTGDERARDVALESGDFFLGEHFTYTGHPGIAPHRGMANALWGEVLLYEMTGDLRYKEAADKLIGIFLKGQQPDGSFLDNYNPMNGEWSGGKSEIFMSWYDIGAFISYHQLTQDPAVRDMFLKLVRYMAPKEYGGPMSLHGLAYAYWITGDPGWAELAEMNLQRIKKNAQKSQNPLLDGLIYDKPIYHRPNIFLSTVPYVFGALEDHFQRRRAQRGQAP